MSSRVRALNITHVHPAQTGDPPLPRHGEHKLSFLDFLHITKIPIQRLFFYSGPDLPPFPAMVTALQASLAATLRVFSPLAGKLAFRPASGDVFIDCSPAAVSSGVKFVEAEFSGSANEMRRLAREEEHDKEAFMQLVPEIAAAQLPAPLLAVQVTRPADDGGAVAVGVSILHAVADGHAVWQFLRAWSTAAREGSLDAAGLPPPTFDRAGIRHRRADELARKVLGIFAPALPLLRPPPSRSTVDITQQSRTFLLRADDILSLKQHIVEGITAVTGGEPAKPPTTYVAISSLVWTSLVRAKPTIRDTDDAYFMVTADCRRRLDPPLGDVFFGNCVVPCYARASAGNLRGEATGAACAALAIQDAIRDYLEAAPPGQDGDGPLSCADRCLAVYGSIPRGSLTAVGSSHRFMAYETDFGWGAPSRVELVSVFGGELVTLLGAGGGAVQVSAALGRALMEEFAAYFVVRGSTSGRGGR